MNIITHYESIEYDRRFIYFYYNVQYSFSGAILIDTYNLSEKAGLAKSIDLEIVSTLEHFGPIPDRIKLFNQIMDAKVNITELTFEEILCKDLKITYDVPIIVICMLIEVH